eukprot:gene1383-1747_t
MKSILDYKNQNKDIKVSNEQWLTILRSRATTGLPAHMNFEILSLSDEEVVSKMEVKDFHMAANGFIHAGSIITLADTCCGFGCFSKLPHGSIGFTTIEMKSNFLGTATVGAELLCSAKLVHEGRSTQVWDATVTHNGKSLALFRCTEMILYPKSTLPNPK